MLGLIFFVSILFILGLICIAQNAIQGYTFGSDDAMITILYATSCFVGIIALLSYWFSGSTPRDYTSKKYQELDKKYHLSHQVVLQYEREPVLLKDVNKVIYTDYVDRWHLFLGLVSFNATNTPCVRIIKDENNYSTTIQDEILRVHYDNNLLRYLTFLLFGLGSWSEIEYTCAYDLATDDSVV